MPSFDTAAESSATQSMHQSCSGTTTFSSGPCGGIALANSTYAPFRQEFTVAPSGTAHTIMVTSASAARFPIISADIIPPGGTVNENVVFYENVLAIPAWTNNATYNAATSSVISQEAGAGLPVYLVDINTAANGGTGVPGMATPTDISGTATTTCPSTTFGNHPNDCGYADIEATVENREDAVGYRFSIPTSGTVTANNGKFSVPLQVQVASTNFKSAYSNMNTANIIGSGELDYTGGSEVGRGFGHDGSTGLPWSGAYGEKVFSNQSGHWFLAQLFDGSAAWGESHFTTKWGVNLGTGSSYQLGQAEAPLFEQKIGTAMASAATIAPVAGITHITGTTAIATITPPAGMSSTVGGCVTFIADGAWSTATGGNITTVLTAVAGTLYQACYDGATWYLK